MKPIKKDSIIALIGEYDISSYIPTTNSLSTAIYYLDNRLCSMNFNCLSAFSNYDYLILQLSIIVNLFGGNSKQNI